MVSLRHMRQMLRVSSYCSFFFFSEGFFGPKVLALVFLESFLPSFLGRLIFVWHLATIRTRYVFTGKKTQKILHEIRGNMPPQGFTPSISSNFHRFFLSKKILSSKTPKGAIFFLPHQLIVSSSVLDLRHQ